MTPAVRPLPQSFEVWCGLSSDAELVRLLDVLKSALVRRGYVVALAAEKKKKSPRRRVEESSVGYCS